METFSEALAVRIAQLTAIRDQKNVEVVRTRAEIEELTEKSATGDTPVHMVFEKQEELKQLEVQARGCQLILDRESRKLDDPQYLELLAAGDEALKKCEDGAFVRRFEAEIAPALREIGLKLGDIYARTHALAAETKEPWHAARRIQYRLGNIRVLDDLAGINPEFNAILNHFAATLKALIRQGGGEFGNELLWMLKEHF